ncbi:MAG: metallophosphoesterase family protein, partial [bacterium]
MKLALLSDIHGNLQALQAVLRDLEQAGVEAVLFLGDAVGYGAHPNEVTELIAQRCQVRILGNHDAGAIGLIDSFLFNDYARSALDYTEKALSEEARESLRSAKPSYLLDEILLVHATPEQPDEWRYCLTARQAARQF